MSLKVLGSSLRSACKSITSKVTKTVSKATGSSSSKSSNKSSSTSNKSGSKATGTVKNSSVGTTNKLPQKETNTKAKGNSAVKTTTKTTPIKPVATKPPVIVKKTKDQSEASYSNNRPAQSYTAQLKKGASNKPIVHDTPTASREGKGTPIYGEKANPTGAKEVLSFGSGFVPYVGDAKDMQEALTGKDLITCKKLTKGERVATSVAAILPVVSGPMLKSTGETAKMKNPTHSQVTGLQRRVINRIKKQIK